MVRTATIGRSHYFAMAFLFLCLSCSGSATFIAKLRASQTDPTSLSVLPYGSTSVSLDWDYSGSVSATFSVAYALGASAPADCSSGTVVSGISGTSKIVTGLTAGQTYSFLVCTGAGTTASSGVSITSKPYAATVVELEDPSPGVDDGPDWGITGDEMGFGSLPLELANGRFVVRDQHDDSVFSEGGGLHVLDMFGTFISSIFGDDVDDRLGQTATGPGTFKLSTGNYVVVSSWDDVGGIVDAGSVKLINGSTNAVITTIAGDTASDQIGENGIFVLTNGNFIIKSRYDDVGGVVDAGSAIYVNGTTGAVIATYTGSDTADYDEMHLIETSTGNFVLGVPTDNIGGAANKGSVIYINATTGAIISTISGDDAGDEFGTSYGLTALTNGNFVMGSRNDTVGGLAFAGSSKLVDGTTGAVISTTSGDNANDAIGNITRALTNGNYAIASWADDVGGLTNTGSVKLLNGTTGAVIATVTGGGVAHDEFGGSLVALTNGNFVILSTKDTVGGVNDAGSVKLVNGSTGAVIATIGGDNASDSFGYKAVELPDGNVVFSNPYDNVGGVVDVGSVKLINGSTGAVIATVAGDNTSDRLSTDGTITVLANNNFIIATIEDDVGGIVDAGSVKIINGSTGAVIATLSGDQGTDYFGGGPSEGGTITLLPNNRFVIASRFDDDGLIEDAGSVSLVDGDTGSILASLQGESNYDLMSFGGYALDGTWGVKALDNGNVVVGSVFYDYNGVSDSGRLFLWITNDY